MCTFDVFKKEGKRKEVHENGYCSGYECGCGGGGVCLSLAVRADSQVTTPPDDPRLGLPPLSRLAKEVTL